MTNVHRIKQKCFVLDICFNGSEWVLYSPFGTKFNGSRKQVMEILKGQL